MIKLSENDKILIVRLTALGDCIHTLPIVSAIKKVYPDIFIGWAVSEKCKDIILDNPMIDKVHIIPKNNNKIYKDAIKDIRNEHYTISIDSQELLKSAVISFLSGAKYRLAHNKSREFSHLFANKHLDAVPIFDCSRHVIERNMDFVRYLGINHPEINFIFPENTLDNLKYVSDLLSNVNINKKTVIISPATTWITKFWAKENWAELINSLSGKCNIILTGSNSDKYFNSEILSLCPDVDIIDLTGKTSILQLKILFENADVVVTPDSGSAHLAAALNKARVIALFGSTSPLRNGAYGNNFNISDDLNCQYCYKKICKFVDGIPPCMNNISVSYVLEKVLDCLKNE